MTLVADAVPLVALADIGSPRRRAILDLLEAKWGPFTPAPVTPEIDIC